MANLKDSKYDGNGGLWSASNHPAIAAQGSIQIGGRKIALTVWHNKKGGGAPNYNITVNEQKTAFEDLLWFKQLHNVDVNTVHDSIIVGRKADVVIADDLVDSKPTTVRPAVPAHPDYNPDEDIPF